MDWARDAARQPNAYAMLLAPAALILASAGQVEEARRIAARLRPAAPDFRLGHLYRSLYFLSDDGRALVNRHARLIDL